MTSTSLIFCSNQIFCFLEGFSSIIIELIQIDGGVSVSLSRVEDDRVTLVWTESGSRPSTNFWIALNQYWGESMRRLIPILIMIRSSASLVLSSCIFCSSLRFAWLTIRHRATSSRTLVGRLLSKSRFRVCRRGKWGKRANCHNPVSLVASCSIWASHLRGTGPSTRFLWCSRHTNLSFRWWLNQRPRSACQIHIELSHPLDQLL